MTGRKQDLIQHAPGCRWYEERLNQPPSCECGAAGRALRSIGRERCSCGKPFPEDGGAEGVCECCSGCSTRRERAWRPGDPICTGCRAFPIELHDQPDCPFYNDQPGREQPPDSLDDLLLAALNVAENNLPAGQAQRRLVNLLERARACTTAREQS